MLKAYTFLFSAFIVVILLTNCSSAEVVRSDTKEIVVDSLELARQQRVDSITQVKVVEDTPANSISNPTAPPTAPTPVKKRK